MVLNNCLYGTKQASPFSNAAYIFVPFGTCTTTEFPVGAFEWVQE